MCGIAGWIALTRSFQQADLRRMVDAIRHRGPDDQGFYLADFAHGNAQIALGHCRLAIIDLAAGHQPMNSRDGNLVLSYNGEIYNYRELRHELSAAGHCFRTDSDTEVLLEAYRHWGEECLNRLRGMFAFALWDSVRQRLLIARDRFGKKPVFLLERGDFLAFASEIKALLTLPGLEPRLSLGALGRYLEYRYVPAPLTLFEGVRKLLPGQYCLWRNGQLITKRYYQPPDCEPRGERAAISTDPLAEFRDALDEAVRIRMVSDVPFGAFLSGGLDSSSVVALMSRHTDRPVRTFSVGFVESHYSELSYARDVARHFHTDHHEITVDASSMLEELPRVTRFRDAPVGEPSDIPMYRLSAEAARSVKMVLTGEGADEILGGYPKHVFERVITRYQSIVPPRLHRKFVIPLVERLPYRYYRLQTLAQNAGIGDRAERMARWFGALSHSERRALSWLPPGAAADVTLPPPASALRTILAFDQQSWLPDNLLERGDRMTMAASIETRMPFMDQQLAALVASLSDNYRIRGTSTKWILRKTMKDIVPKHVLERSKVGFRVPVNEWFRTKWRSTLLDDLLGASSLSLEILPRPFVRSILNEHLEGRRNHEKLLWTLLTLEVFRREYRLGIAGRHADLGVWSTGTTARPCASALRIS
jgi:asparagine synthase (glutamine-hydrolysing)